MLMISRVTPPTETEVENRMARLLIDHLDHTAVGRPELAAECMVRSTVLQFRLTPDQAQVRFMDCPQEIRYAAILEAQWLYGERPKPWKNDGN